MYTEKVMEHFTNPHNSGELENANAIGTVGNAKCGDIQYLDPYSRDATAISYEEKLTKYLTSALIGDELAEKISKLRVRIIIKTISCHINICICIIQIISNLCNLSLEIHRVIKVDCFSTLVKNI